MSWVHEILGLETVVNNGRPRQQVRHEDEEQGLFTQAIVKYTTAAGAGTAGAAIMRAGVNLGMLPTTQGYKEAAAEVPRGALGKSLWAITRPRKSIPLAITRAMWGSESKVDKELQEQLRPFVKDVNLTVREAAKKRESYPLMFQVGNQLFGTEGVRQVIEAGIVAQTEKGDVKDVESRFAKELVLQRRLHNSVNPSGWIGAKSKELINGVVASGGAKQIDMEEYTSLQGILESIDETEGVDIAKVTTRNSFWASVFMRAKRLNPEIFLGDGGYTITMTKDGKVSRRIGYEFKEISPDPRQLIIQTEMPDWVEATKTIADGKMEIPGVAGSVRKVLAKGNDPLYAYRDIGVVTLGRSGAGEAGTKVSMPTISVARTIDTIRAGVSALGLSTGRIEAIQKETPEVMSESPEQFRGEVVEGLTNAVLHQMPRQRMVLEEVKRIEAETSSSRLEEDTILKKLNLPTDLPENIARAILDQDAHTRATAIKTFSRKVGEDKAQQIMYILEQRASLKLGRL